MKNKNVNRSVIDFPYFLTIEFKEWFSNDFCLWISNYVGIENVSKNLNVQFFLDQVNEDKCAIFFLDINMLTHSAIEQLLFYLLQLKPIFMVLTLIQYSLM